MERSSSFPIIKRTIKSFKYFQTLTGPHFYEMGDHGGILVAVKQWEPTKEILFV